MTVLPACEKDIRHTGLFAEALDLCRQIREPGTGAIREIIDFDAHPGSAFVLFSGANMARLEGLPETRICAAEFETGAVRVLTFGPNSDRMPKFSPDGTKAAFLSDREQAGEPQLYHLDLPSGKVRPAPAVAGWVEAFDWSPDGKSLLLLTASSGSDSSSLQGAVTRHHDDGLPAWLPSLRHAGDSAGRRELWIYAHHRASLRPVPTQDLTIWEAAWCGGGIAAIASTIAGEDGWYSAGLWLIDIENGAGRLVYEPTEQIACLSASPSGQRVALVEALASDRGNIAGELLIADLASNTVVPMDTAGIDISSTAWRDDDHVTAAGHRVAHSVVLDVDCTTGKMRETWASGTITSVGRYMNALPYGHNGDAFLFVAQGFDRAPEIVEVRDSAYRVIAGCGESGFGEILTAAEHVAWQAPDGLEMEGWLLTPRGSGPFPLVACLHGGPVWHWRPHWLGTTWALTEAMLLKHGYALFLPNPRGSTGKGRDFVRLVQGDEGGADTHDILSGIDALVERKIADPARLGVTGLSYGGFMSAWLVTQDDRFAASVPVSPGTDRISHMLTTNIPAYVRLFLRERYDTPGGHYFMRSPVMRTGQVKTPVLTICGALDRCTPPEQAREFHNALLEHHGTSLLVTYPEEGHGVRRFPAVADCAARIVGWFETYMPSRNAEREHA